MGEYIPRTRQDKQSCCAKVLGFSNSVILGAILDHHTSSFLCPLTLLDRANMKAVLIAVVMLDKFRMMRSTAGHGWSMKIRGLRVARDVLISPWPKSSTNAYLSSGICQ